MAYYGLRVCWLCITLYIRTRLHAVWATQSGRNLARSEFFKSHPRPRALVPEHKHIRVGTLTSACRQSVNCLWDHQNTAPTPRAHIQPYRSRTRIGSQWDRTSTRSNKKLTLAASAGAALARTHTACRPGPGVARSKRAIAGRACASAHAKSPRSSARTAQPCRASIAKVSAAHWPSRTAPAAARSPPRQHLAPQTMLQNRGFKGACKYAAHDTIQKKTGTHPFGVSDPPLGSPVP